jgi:hypothetical protein
MIRSALLAILFTATALAQQEMITTSWLPQAVINKPYSVALTAAPGASPLWSLSQGTLPDGLSFSSSGVISGVPTTLGAYFLLFGAGDPVYGYAFQALELDVVLGPLNIANSSLPVATQNVPYTATLQPAGGIPPYKFAFSSTVTLGMSLDPNSGTLSGTPTSQGAFGIPIQLTDSIGDQLQRAYTLFVAAPLSVLTTSLPNGTSGVAYSRTLTAGGGQAPYSWSASGLPPGLQIDATSGKITGTPTTNGIYPVNIQLTDFGQRTASRSIVITIGPGVVITNTLLALGSVGSPYSQTLVATGGQAPYSWSMAAGGSMPPGLSLNPSTGVISGTPQDAASLTFSVKVTDSQGNAGYGTFTINILGPLKISGGPLPGGLHGSKYSHALSVTGGAPPYRWSASNLPPGLRINPSSGLISGIFANPGYTTASITVTDSLNESATESMAISAAAATVPSITIGGLPASPGFLQQPAITVTLASPYTADLTGTLTLSFASSVGGTDQLIQFGTGGTTAAFTIPAGTTQAQFSGKSSVSLLTGTVAGTITLTVTALTSGGSSVLPTPAPTAAITTNPSVPFLSSVNFGQTPGGVTAIIKGFSSTRDMSTGTFQFAPSTNATISTTTVSVPLASAFTTWYQSSSSSQYGSEFTLTVPFAVQGSASDVVAVTVTLTNSKGDSKTCSAGAGSTVTCQ